METLLSTLVFACMVGALLITLLALALGIVLLGRAILKLWKTP